MKQILMVASTCSHIRQFHLPYLKALESQGYLVDIACPEEEEVSDFLSYPITLKKSMVSLGNFRVLVEILDILKKKEYDRVITHSTLASFWSRFALCFSRKKPKIICVSHGYLFHKNSSTLRKNTLLLAEKIFSSQTDVLLTMNHWDYAIAQKHHLGKKVVFISGMGVEVPSKNTHDFQGFFQSFPNEIQFLAYGGEFSKRKNQCFLISVMEKLPKEVHLLLAGEGKELESCKKMVNTGNLRERIHFLGQVPNLAEIYEQARIVLSSSESEGLPFHLMEAMALGKPILASDTKGHEDLLPRDCLFPLTEEVFLEKIRELLGQPERQQSLGAENKARFQERYQLEVVLPQVLRYYTED